MDKDHGRIVTREVWCVATDPKTLGLAGVAQAVRLHNHTQEVRQGKVTKETDDVRFAVTSYWPQEANPGVWTFWRTRVERKAFGFIRRRRFLPGFGR